MTKRTGGAMEDLVRIVSAADGEIVGRTRLQKAAFLLELAGLGSGYEFKYKHYGPFSEDLASAVVLAPLLFDLHEDQRQSGWGGHTLSSLRAPLTKGTMEILTSSLFLEQRVQTP